MTFVIDRDNVISTQEPGVPLQVGETPFSSLKELAEVSQNRNHSKSDITDIWNGFAGEAGAFEDLKTQKAFKNRMYGLQAIWKAIQRLDPSAAPYQDTPAVERAERELKWPHGRMLENTTKEPANKTRKPKVPKTPKEPRKTAAKAEKKPATKPREPRTQDGTPRPGSHLETLVRMISRKTGATVAEVMDETGWTATHTVRGRISILGSKGMKIERFKNETRGTVYRVVA